MAYCDTNMITAFINKNRLKTLGKYGYNKFKDSINAEFPIAESKSKKVGSCIIAMEPLVSDIGKHEPSMGAVLTYTGLKNVEIVKVDGLNKGKELYNKTCGHIPKESRFYKKFCKDGKLKENKELFHNDLNDIKHFGSAVEVGVKKFITMNKRDFRPVARYANIKIE